MKAARLHEFHRPLVLEDVPDPEVTGPFDVIVRIGAAGLCRTDLHIWEGQFDEAQKAAGQALPYSPGHENAGWVEAIGAAVTNVAVGDKVILHPLITCGLCRACRDGDDVHCDNSVFPGLFAPGGFAQYLKSGARSVIRLDDVTRADRRRTARRRRADRVPRDQEGAAVALPGHHLRRDRRGRSRPHRHPVPAGDVRDADRRARRQPGRAGAGHRMGCRRDRPGRRRPGPRGAGAHRWPRADVVLDFVGESGAEKWGVDLLKRKGYYFVIGYGGTLEVPTMRMILTEINFIGNLVGSYNDLVELMALAARGKVRLHTASYPLADINTAIDDLDSGRLRGRGILVP